MEKFNIENQYQNKKQTYNLIVLFKVMVLARLLHTRAGEKTKYTICKEIEI